MITTDSPRPLSTRPSPHRRNPRAMDYVKAVTSIPASSLPTPSLLASVGQTGYFGPATVCEINAGERLVLVQWEQAGQSRRVWARPTFSIAKPLIPGDVALALSQNPTDVYLIGLISDAPRGDAPETGSLQTSGGASVRVVKSAGEEVVEVRSKQGSLVIEYRPESGKAVVNVEHGDLEFTTQNGSIAFNSAQKISLTSARLETHADTVVAQAKNVYLSVEELSQLQAGRTRTLVKGSCHLQARDAFLNAEEDFKIDGKQIHLG